MKSKLIKIDFTNKKIIVGLDVHSKTWYATIIIEEVLTTKTFVADPKKLAEYLKTNYPLGDYIVGYEAGCFGFWIKEELEALGITVIVINPADIPTTDKDKKSKTDKIDSKKLALGIKSGLVKGIYAPDRQSQEYRGLSRRRQDITKKLTRVKNQIKATLKYYGIGYPDEYEDKQKHWSNNFIKWLATLKFKTSYGTEKMESYLRELLFLRTEKLNILRQLRKLSTEEKFKKECKILRSIPGIGIVSAIIFMTEIVEIGRFKSRDEFLSYIGLSPNEHSSGEKRKIGHMTKRCNHSLRTIFIESAWIAIRKDPALTNYYNETYKKTGKSKAIIKVAKKLAARARYILINNTEYVIGVAA